MKPRIISWRRYLPVALLLAATAGVLLARSKAEHVPPHEALSAFPAAIGDWQGTDVPITQNELDVLGPGDFMMRNYQRLPAEPAVNLFIAFFPSQRSGDSIHSPQNCLPGAGWTPVEKSHISVVRPDGSVMRVNKYVIAKGLDRQLVYYWYQAHGRVTPSEYWAKAYLVSDAIRMNRTDGAMIRIVTPIVREGGEKEAETRALGFAHLVLPLLDRYIPN
ncbi:MAG: exosortase C-terminal domain/associated protein EpsI [Candidatus Acidiferrales bacterium]